MSTRSRILQVFDSSVPAEGDAPLLLDLTLWHKWRLERGMLPSSWGPSVIDSARGLGTAIWAPFKPWRVEYDGVTVTQSETDDQRDIIYQAGGRTLLARWTRGPDGDWWQTEYPVRTSDDLHAAVEVAAARRYVIDTTGLADWRAAVGEDGVVPLELPMRPFSDVLHTMIGWGEGLALMFGAGKPLVEEIMASLDQAQARLAEELAKLAGDLFLAPDNLDGQYVSPRVFKEYLTPSYSATAALGRGCGKRLVVHVGGPARKLVPLLAQAEVDGIQGIAGPPQGDIDLAQAREVAGPGVALWGGIPQDLLIVEHDEQAFEAATKAAIEQARTDPGGRTIIGVADRVPVDADLGRLKRLVALAG